MSWNADGFPAMSHEALFGDRVVPCFRDRPRHFFDLLANAAARRMARRWSWGRPA
jgi:hypothetical protein